MEGDETPASHDRLDFSPLSVLYNRARQLGRRKTAYQFAEEQTKEGEEGEGGGGVGVRTKIFYRTGALHISTLHIPTHLSSADL